MPIQVNGRHHHRTRSVKRAVVRKRLSRTFSHCWGRICKDLRVDKSDNELVADECLASGNTEL